MRYILSVEYKRIEDRTAVLATPLLAKDKEGWKEMSFEEKKALLPYSRKSQIELLFPEGKNVEKKVERDLYPNQLIILDLDSTKIKERENAKKNEAIYFYDIPEDRFYKGYYTPLLSDNIFIAIPRSESMDAFQKSVCYGLNPKRKSCSVVLYDENGNLAGPYRVSSIESAAKEGAVAIQREDIPNISTKLTGYRLIDIKVGSGIFSKGISYSLAIPPLKSRPEKKKEAKPQKSLSAQKEAALEAYKILEGNLAHKTTSSYQAKDELSQIKAELEALIKRIDAIIQSNADSDNAPYKKGRQDGKKRAELFSLASSSKNINESSEIYELYVLYVLRSELENYGFAEAKESLFTYKIKAGTSTRINNTFYYKKGDAEAVLYYQPVIDQRPEDDENHVGLYRRKAENEKDDDKYTPDFVLKVTRGGVSEYLVMDAKYKPLKNIENEMERLVFRYSHSLSTISSRDRIGGIAIIYGKPFKKDMPRFQFEDMSFQGKSPFVFLCPLSEDGVPSHYTLKRFLKPFLFRNQIQ